MLVYEAASVFWHAAESLRRRREITAGRRQAAHFAAIIDQVVAVEENHSAR
jgi:hypothetical protein